MGGAVGGGGVGIGEGYPLVVLVSAPHGYHL